MNSTWSLCLHSPPGVDADCWVVMCRLRPPHGVSASVLLLNAVRLLFCREAHQYVEEGHVRGKVVLQI